MQIDTEATSQPTGKCPKCRNIMVGRHCLTQDCGFSRPLAHTPKDALDNAGAEIAHVRQLNSNAMLALMSRHGITIPARNATHWRPTVPSAGHIPGFEREFRVLCTDGCVAWFIDTMDVLFYGHVQHFTGDIKPLHSTSSGSAQRAEGTQKSTKTPRKSKVTPKLTLALALDALRNIKP